ncbi:MAG TPA: CYTH domain-containing protein [Mycobacterium sp.]|nr:CYTH domain-containing protein [Mycobacterium sp.]
MDEPTPGASTSRHREFERKFEVLDSTPLPSFVRHAPIADVVRRPTETLHAVYYDTPEHDLAANRITLRRRTGGNDAGWHLKLPAETVARTEIRTEFGACDNDEVPATLGDLVAAIVKDRPLVVIARITNHRTVDELYGKDGTPLAEFCDDHVIASAEGHLTEHRWREWELELAEDTARDGVADERLMTTLSTLLLDAGAVPASHASKLARTLAPEG